MSLRRSLSSLRSGSHSARTHPPTVVLLGALAVGLCCLVAVSLVGTAGATVPDGQYEHNGTDDQGPQMTGGERVNDTAIAVTIADNHDVNESTITPEDFLLERASVQNVSTTENGTNATAVLKLSRRVDIDDMTVALRADAGIVDTNGNRIDTDDIVIVDNMDGVPPALVDFSVTNATGSPATISLEASERLGDLNVSVSGAASDHLDITGFEENGTVYERTYRPETDGTVVVTLENVTDESNNTRDTDSSAEILVDLTGPDADAALDLANSANLTITFDGGQSSDANGITTYTWDFGDGTSTTGQRVSHEFVPGNYTVTLTAADPYGNVGTDTLTLNLSTGSGNVTDINESELGDRLGTGLSVDVQRATEGVSAEAVVAVENGRAGTPVTIGRVDTAGTALATHSGVTLSGIEVTLATNRSFDLGLSMAGADTVSDAAGATGMQSLAGFTVVNAVPDGDVANATMQFSVEQSRLAELNVTASDVALYRQHDGEWRRLETTALGAANGTQRFQADSPGFSRFAVLAEGTPAVGVTAAEVTTPAVEPGEEFSVTATVENPRNESATFTAGLAVDGGVVTTEQLSIGAESQGTVSLNTSLDETGTYDLSVNDTAAGQVTVTAASENTGNNDSDDMSDGNESGGDDGQFVVTNASLSVEQVDPGTPFLINATVENTGTESAGFTAGIEANGSVVYTKPPSEQIPPGETRQIQVQFFFEDAGEYHIAINGTDAGTLRVGDVGNGSEESDGGGLLASVLGLVPMGIVQPLVLFVLLPLAVIFGILKGLAYYLGY